MSADLRLGKWQDVLQDVECDTLIVDAPYSERTHSGHSSATNDSALIEPGAPRDNRKRQLLGLGAVRRPINYESWGHDEVSDFVETWSPRAKGWFVTITDNVLAPIWSACLAEHGRYVFAPLPFVETGSRVRLSGDGPSSWTCWLVVARPKVQAFARWGTLPGAYVDQAERGRGVVGGKPLGLMRAIVRDYSRPGDIICDPCVGGGTTLLAALMEGRRAVGSEMDPKHFEIARKRLAKGYTPPLFTDRPASTEQMKLGDE